METDDMSLRVASFAYYLDTAKESLVHRVSAQETPIALSSGKTNSPTIKPPFSIKFSKPKDSQDSLTNIRVDSFSYLSTAGDNFVFEVPGPIEDPTAAFSFSHEIPKEGEIGVFGADKYFNMKMEYQTQVKHNYKNEGPAHLPRVGSNIMPRTPSLCSEASSWNSQTSLLPDLHRSGSQTKQKKATGRRIFTGFGCRGPCFDKKSVHINEMVAQGAYYGSKPTRTGSERIDHLASLLAGSNPGTENLSIKNQLKVEPLDESRHSIEVFGSGTTSKGDVVTNMERKLSMLTWDAIPKGRTLPTSTLGSSTICDDMASDASSDLFEIENISGSIHPLLTSETADDMSTCVSPTSHYAPSEASIQWSVVTASAADYSVLPDYNDEMSVSVAGDVISRNNVTNRSSKTRSEWGKEVQKSRPGGLLGCKSHKAVDVAENVCHKTNEKAKYQGLDLSVSLGKSQTSRGRVKDIDTLQLPRSFTNGGLSP
ncbi:hypothetical protein Pfo_020644 [Paulownia fortunei]|nr:hypothetical protein Pfo_020644 [Paulownia fortunei]